MSYINEYDEATINGDLLDLSCANRDGMVIIPRQHVVAVAVNWLVKNGQLHVYISSGGHLTVTYDEGDGGALCAQEYAEITQWLGGTS